MSIVSKKHAQRNMSKIVATPIALVRTRRKTFQLDRTQADQMVLYKDGKPLLLYMGEYISVLIDDIMAVNKPSGLAVHDGPKLGASLMQYLHHWQYEQTEPPNLAHRLDK